MSSSENRRADRDAGFSLVEIVVAMGLTAAVLTAALPMLLSMLSATTVTKLQTQAKNLSQERLEQIRDLRYHVARQNGPFLDLLDLYYTNADPASPETTVVSGGNALKGRYVRTGGGVNGEPAAPYYRVSTGPLAGASGFSQVITAEFLEASGRTKLPTVRFENVYDSQVVGRDAPPTLMLGITVITSWTEAGKPKSFRTYTQVTESRPETPVIQSQARATAIELSSNAADGTTLSVQGGVATLDGAQSSGSYVSGYVAGGIVRRTGHTPLTGNWGKFLLPSEAVTTGGSSSAVNGPGCSWYAVGNSSVDNVTAVLTQGLPKSPSNVDGATPATTPANVLTGRLNATGSTTCPLLGFDNLVGGGTPVGSTLIGSAPYAIVRDGVSTSGAVSGSAYVTSSLLTATTQETRSGVRAVMDRPAVLLPGSSDNTGNGLVTARLSSASVDCVSGTPTTNGTVRGRYTLELRWWGRSATEATPRWRTATWTYDSAASSPMTVTGDAWQPSQVFLSDGQPLSAVVSGDPPAAVSTGATSGARGFPSGIMTLTTAPTLSNEPSPGFSSVKLTLGQLTCIADDLR